MNNDPNTFEMAENPCRVDLDPLVPFLQSARKSPVQIQAKAVENLGAMRLQILLSARNKWRDEQISFEVLNISKAFRKSLSLLGLSENEFDEEVVK